MILTHLDFYENKDKETSWEIHNVNLGMFTLVIGLNATGKTRLIKVISRLVTMLSKQTPRLLDGNWCVTLSIALRCTLLIYWNDMVLWLNRITMRIVKNNSMRSDLRD